jgi:hypothetical protein
LHPHWLQSQSGYRFDSKSLKCMSNFLGAVSYSQWLQRLSARPTKRNDVSLSRLQIYDEDNSVLVYYRMFWNNKNGPYIPLRSVQRHKHYFTRKNTGRKNLLHKNQYR